MDFEISYAETRRGGSLVWLHDKRPFFTPRKTRMPMNLDTWLAAILFLRETFFASSIIACWQWRIWGVRGVQMHPLWRLVMYFCVSSYRWITHTECWSTVGWKTRKSCLSVWSYFADVMLTYERYQALRAINIRVPGEPGNEAKPGDFTCAPVSLPDQWP